METYTKIFVRMKNYRRCSYSLFAIGYFRSFAVPAIDIGYFCSHVGVGVSDTLADRSGHSTSASSSSLAIPVPATPSTSANSAPTGSGHSSPTDGSASPDPCGRGLSRPTPADRGSGHSSHQPADSASVLLRCDQHRLLHPRRQSI